MAKRLIVSATVVGLIPAQGIGLLLYYPFGNETKHDVEFRHQTHNSSKI